MAVGGHSRFFNLDERKLAVAVFALFSSWMLAFPFEGRILYALTAKFNIDPQQLVFGAVAAQALGLLFWGFVIKTKKAAKRLMLCSMLLCVLASAIFFYPPSYLWNVALICCSFFISACVVAWAYFFKSSTPTNERIKTAADGLIYTNILMIILNMVAINLSPYIGLGISMLVLGVAFVLTLLLPVNGEVAVSSSPDLMKNPIPIGKSLAFLGLFIVIITINSGLMYQVLNPAFAHLEWLTTWYWAIPYIIALYIMKNLPRKISRSYILYVAIAMIGLSFVSFMTLDRSVLSYLVINTLMLGACGVYDLFWWSILGEMLDLDKNPAKIFGIGFSANVLGVLIGGVIGKTLSAFESPQQNSAKLALAVVCVTLIILPLLHKHLATLLKDHEYLKAFSEMSVEDQDNAMVSFLRLGQLTERENEIAALLLTGKTYRMIACELYVSENTIKTHIKNIYAKLNVQGRAELINIMLGQRIATHQ